MHTSRNTRHSANMRTDMIHTHIAHTNTHTHMHIQTHTCTHKHTHTCTHKHDTHTYMHAHTNMLLLQYIRLVSVWVCIPKMDL